MAIPPSKKGYTTVGWPNAWLEISVRSRKISVDSIMKVKGENEFMEKINVFCYII